MRSTILLRSSALGGADAGLQAMAKFAPGLVLCSLIAAAAYVVERAEAWLAGRAWLEAIVVAILVGTGIRTVWTPGAKWKPGIDLSAKVLLEIAVVLLGAGLSAAMILSIGHALLISIVVIVAGTIAVSFGIGRLLGLSKRLAILVACGNSICGNSAIAAVAPVIGADSDDVASSIAFTAVLGVIVVLVLPFLSTILSMTEVAYGALAGLTVYAVPQVLAATAPVGQTAAQIGTLVKLTRVLMLGPVCVLLSLFSKALEGHERTPQLCAGRPAIHKLVPWFVIGFLAMAGLRSGDLIPSMVIAPLTETAAMFTVVSMAALGLGVDIRAVSKAGGPVTVTVVMSLIALGALSLVMIRSLGL